MTDFELLIPVDWKDADGMKTAPAPTVSRSSSFSRLSLARFSQRLCRRGWTVGDGPDKENAGVVGRAPPLRTAVGKRVKFDKRVYHGPIRNRRDETMVAVCRGILKSSTAATVAAGYSNTRCDDAVPNRMRMYDIPVTSFYIGADEHLQLMPLQTAKRRNSATVTPETPEGREAKKTRRFGTELGSYYGRIYYLCFAVRCIIV